MVLNMSGTAFSPSAEEELNKNLAIAAQDFNKNLATAAKDFNTNLATAAKDFNTNIGSVCKEASEILYIIKLAAVIGAVGAGIYGIRYAWRRWIQ